MSIEEPVIDADGDESHPAFGLVSVNRRSCSPGAVLFDSEITHQRVVVLQVHGATRKRGLNRDWIHPERAPKIEIEMSEAQWASLVSSFGTQGTPCTLTFTQEDGRLPEIPFAPRLEISQQEVREAAHEQYARALDALQAVEEKATKANVRALRIALENASANVEYTARTMTEHAENVVTKARADIEAMVLQHAQALGLDPAAVTGLRMLESGM